jgi:hypothetical protein
MRHDSSPSITEELILAVKKRQIIRSIRSVAINIFSVGSISIFGLILLRTLELSNSMADIFVVLLIILYSIWILTKLRLFQTKDACSLLDQHGALHDRMISNYFLELDEPNSARSSIVKKQLDEKTTEIVASKVLSLTFSKAEKQKLIVTGLFCLSTLIFCFVTNAKIAAVNLEEIIEIENALSAPDLPQEVRNLLENVIADLKSQAPQSKLNKDIEEALKAIQRSRSNKNNSNTLDADTGTSKKTGSQQEHSESTPTPTPLPKQTEPNAENQNTKSDSQSQASSKTPKQSKDSGQQADTGSQNKEQNSQGQQGKQSESQQQKKDGKDQSGKDEKQSNKDKGDSKVESEKNGSTESKNKEGKPESNGKKEDKKGNQSEQKNKPEEGSGSQKTPQQESKKGEDTPQKPEEKKNGKGKQSSPEKGNEKPSDEQSSLKKAEEALNRIKKGKDEPEKSPSNESTGDNPKPKSNKKQNNRKKDDQKRSQEEKGQENYGNKTSQDDEWQANSKGGGKAPELGPSTKYKDEEIKIKDGRLDTRFLSGTTGNKEVKPKPQPATNQENIIVPEPLLAEKNQEQRIPLEYEGSLK